MDRRRGALLVLVVLLATLATGPAAAAEPRADPETDVIGWENGYWHDEPIAVDQTDTDGLNDTERAAYVNRTMARIEVLREREFTATVPVTVVDRATYGNQTRGNASPAYRAWNNQVWEALFIVGEDQDIQDVLHSTATAATSGAYVFSTDEIQIVTDSPDRPTIDRRTLAHELVHAQQDQYHNLTNLTGGARTQDEQLARRGLTEGEANYLEERYLRRCGESWDCVGTPLTIDGGGGGLSNRGVLYTLFQPYSDGPPWVHATVESRGWAGIDAAFSDPPDSSEQIIHHTDDAVVPLRVRDEARAGWEPFPDQGVNGSDVAGEASMYVMLWYQAWEYGAETVPVGSLSATNAEYDTFNYAVPETAGWGNDAILPYRRATASGPEYGYVWLTAWDSDADARQFHRAYLAILRAQGARSVGGDTWVIDDGPFADAFRVVLDGRRVSIVNGPEPAALDELRPALAPTPTPTTTLPSLTPTTTDPASPMGPAEPDGNDGSLTEAPPQPGFGPLAALAALAAGGVLARRRGG